MKDLNPVVKPGDEIEVYIDGMTDKGEGIGRFSGLAVFVPRTVPGDRVIVQVEDVRKNFARASLKEVLAASRERRVPNCRFLGNCGGCQLQELDYQAQLRWKRRQVVDALRRLGGIFDVVVRDTLGMAHPWGYRHKVHFQVGVVEGRLALGFFAPGSHRFIPLGGRGGPGKECLLLDSEMVLVAQTLENLCRDYDVTPYDWTSGRGILRHVVLRKAALNGEIMVVLVTSAAPWPKGEGLAAELMAQRGRVTTVVRNINKARSRVVMGRENVILAGPGYITDGLAGLKFRISPSSFYQVNPSQAAVLYEQALAYADLKGDETVVDAYCGTGTIALYLARQASRVIGIESVAEAVADAEANARLNNIRNANFIAGRVEDVLPALPYHPQVAVLDPPRQGCAPAVLTTLAERQVPRIVYVSCNPATLARDLKHLCQYGYKVFEVQPVDMFPQTGHVECIVLIKRVESRMG